jgi:hypothetical protein
MNDEPSDLDAALACVDNDNAGHWPTVAGILADAYREQRDRLAEALRKIKGYPSSDEYIYSTAEQALQFLPTNEQ